MENMRDERRKRNVLRWIGCIMAVTVLGAACGLSLFLRHGNGGITAWQATPAAPGGISSSADMAAASATKTFSEDGYAFIAPDTWSVEQTGSGTIAVHPAPIPGGVACTIDISSYSFLPGADTAGWIAHRVGADPSLAVVERSSEDVSFDGATGVKWAGTIDGVPTTLIYAFTDSHAYEIAPSSVDPSRCDDAFQIFLAGLTF